MTAAMTVFYCVNRVGNDTERATFSPDEVCTLTMGFIVETI